MRSRASRTAARYSRPERSHSASSSNGVARAMRAPVAVRGRPTAASTSSKRTSEQAAVVGGEHGRQASLGRRERRLQVRRRLGEREPERAARQARSRPAPARRTTRAPMTARAPDPPLDRGPQPTLARPPQQVVQGSECARWRARPTRRSRTTTPTRLPPAAWRRSARCLPRGSLAYPTAREPLHPPDRRCPRRPRRPAARGGPRAGARRWRRSRTRQRADRPPQQSAPSRLSQNASPPASSKMSPAAGIDTPAT